MRFPNTTHNIHIRFRIRDFNCKPVITKYLICDRPTNGPHSHDKFDRFCRLISSIGFEMINSPIFEWQLLILSIIHFPLFQASTSFTKFAQSSRRVGQQIRHQLVDRHHTFILRKALLGRVFKCTNGDLRKKYGMYWGQPELHSVCPGRSRRTGRESSFYQKLSRCQAKIECDVWSLCEKVSIMS